MFLQVHGEQPSVQPDAIFHIYDWPITNTFLCTLIIILLLLVLIFATKKFSLRPKKLQLYMEAFYELLYGFIAQLIGNEKTTKKVFKISGPLFIFILLSNAFGIIPIITSITYDGKSLFRTPTNDFNMTFTLALGMIILIQFASIKEFGILKHIGKYIKIVDVFKGFSKGIMNGFTSLIDFAIGILDIISEFARTVSLSLRLFGNMFAGEVLTVILMGALAYILPAIWLGMGFLTTIVQAIVFTSLTSIYYSLAISEE